MIAELALASLLKNVISVIHLKLNNFGLSELNDLNRRYVGS